MKVRRLTPLLVTIPVVAGLVVPSLAGVAGAAATGTDTVTGSYSPMARAPKDDAAAEDAKNKKKEQSPCPQDMWTVPLEIEGLACVLLLPKDNSKEKKNEEDKAGKGGKGGDDSGS